MLQKPLTPKALTAEEIRFVRDLGKGTERRETLLRQYITAADKRVNWDGIDKAAVLRYAGACLAQVDSKRLAMLAASEDF